MTKRDGKLSDAYCIYNRTGFIGCRMCLEVPHYADINKATKTGLPLSSFSITAATTDKCTIFLSHPPENIRCIMQQTNPVCRTDSGAAARDSRGKGRPLATSRTSQGHPPPMQPAQRGGVAQLRPSMSSDAASAADCENAGMQGWDANIPAS